VPNVERVRGTDAQTTLTNLGFQVQVQEGDQHTQRRLCNAQDPVDVKLPKGDTVTIWVSIGDKVTMPDVTGKKRGRARRLITTRRPDVLVARCAGL